MKLRGDMTDTTISAAVVRVPDDYPRRRDLGKHFRSMRDRAGLLQTQVANALGCGFTHVSAMELGRTWIADTHYIPMAKVLEIDPKSFAMLVLRHKDPRLFDMIFGTND
jgi:transcriptional regulator with XRE-family HTH domain